MAGDCPHKKVCVSAPYCADGYHEMIAGCLPATCWSRVCITYQHARADAAEARVAELEMPGNDEQISVFRMLWEEYGAAPDDTLTADAQRLKRELREIVGIDAVMEGE